MKNCKCRSEEGTVEGHTCDLLSGLFDYREWFCDAENDCKVQELYDKFQKENKE